MLTQHALVIDTSQISGLSASQQRGDKQALFAQILKSAEPPELAETPATLNYSQVELSDEALQQLITDLKQLFSTTEGAIPKEAATRVAAPSPGDHSDLQLMDESGVTATTTVEQRQPVMPGGNELPPPPERLLNILNSLPPKQFNEVMAQLPEVEASLKKALTADGHPVASSVILKNITLINGRLVSGDGSPINAKADNTLITTEEERSTLVDSRRRELPLNAQVAVSATQYRAQMLQNASNGNNGQTGGGVHVDDERLSLAMLDTGQGTKSQQHDRLMATLFSMRQELATDRQPLDARQRTLLTEQLNSSATLSDLASDTPEGLASLLTPLTGSQTGVVTAVNLPLQHPRWGTAVSEKVIWMMNAQIKEAAIKLNPASLGSIEIRLSLVDDQANVTFNVLTSQAKEALESALPRLREMLAEQGIALNDANVSDQSEHQDDNPQPLLADIPHQQEESSDHHGDAALQRAMTVNAQAGVDIYI